MATRSLGKGDEKDRMVLKRSMELAKDTRGVEEMVELDLKWDLEIVSEEVSDRQQHLFNWKMIHSYQDINKLNTSIIRSKNLKPEHFLRMAILMPVI